MIGGALNDMRVGSSRWNEENLQPCPVGRKGVDLTGGVDSIAEGFWLREKNKQGPEFKQLPRSVKKSGW